MPEPTQTAQVFRLIEQAEAYADSQAKSRETALRYYNGDNGLLTADEGFSSVVSRDVRKHVQKIMPSIMRTILSNDRIVEYEPAGPGPEKEEQAEQASDYVNAWLIPECDGERSIHDAIFDALVIKTGILNWSAYRKSRVVVQQFSGQPPEALLGLDEIGEVSDVVQDEQTGMLSFRLRREVSEVKIALRAVPRGAFLIHPSATGIDDSPVVGERQSLTRSDLVSRGYDRDLVWQIRADSDPADPDSEARRGDDRSDVDSDVAKAMETVRVYDVYVLMDDDGDGIAELHHYVVGEGAADSEDAGHIVLEHEFATEIPYSEVIAEYEAHQFEGHSVAEDLLDIQDVNTALTRQTLDNLYQVNDPTPYIQVDAVEDLDPLYKRVRGKPILLAQGRSAAEAVQYQPVPFVGDKSWAMKQQLDAEATQRTGITDASGGLDADAVTGMSATGASIVNDAAIARAEMLTRNIARGGLRRAFRGLLRLVIAHADQERTMRLRGKWVTMDPRVWDAEMDCTVNVGLGAGTRERDMLMLQQVLGIQREVMANLGAMNPLVKPDQLYNTLKKICETAGFPSADPYFTKPDPQEIQAMQQQVSQQPSEMEAFAKVEEAKSQARLQVEQIKQQAQMQIKGAEQAYRSQIDALKAEKDAEIARMKAELDLVKHNDQMQLEWARLGQQAMEPKPESLPYVAR